MPRRPALPKDPSLRAKAILDMAIGDTAVPEEGARARAGRLGGKIGGKARARGMTQKERSEAAKFAAKVRWSR
jgi:hypothetical protein